MVKFISVAVVALMVSSAAAPAFAKGDKHHGGGKGGSSHSLAGLHGGKGFGGGKLGAAAAVFGLALEALSH